MKKYQKISILIAVLFSLLISIVYAATENSSSLDEEAESLTEAAISSQIENILEPIGTNSTIRKIEAFDDKMTDQKISKVYTDNYIVSLNNSTKQLVGIYEKEAKYNLKTTVTKESAREFITSKYNEMNLPSEYTLVYLEKFDDYVWEADFQKEYNGLYNMYEAVKVFFNPENEEIVALTIFNDPYTETSETTISSEEAVSRAANSIDNINSESIKDSKLTLIKGNSFYKENKDKTIHKAWVLVTQEDDQIFVDAASGEIIGGDSIND
ncbi:MAG: hypothetical protein IKG42_02985 [Clostridia bacterium]|nr:hypothetical protein [Clostridia bacterium]